MNVPFGFSSKNARKMVSMSARGCAIQKGSVVRGCQQNWDALSAWVDKMIVPYVLHGEVTSERENQSLPGVLTRLLTHEPSFSKWVEKHQSLPVNSKARVTIRSRDSQKKIKLDQSLEYFEAFCRDLLKRHQLALERYQGDPFRSYERPVSAGHLDFSACSRLVLASRWSSRSSSRAPQKRR